jgi:hypothetical protein
MSFVNSALESFANSLQNFKELDAEEPYSKEVLKTSDASSINAALGALQEELNTLSKLDHYARHGPLARAETTVTELAGSIQEVLAHHLLVLQETHIDTSDPAYLEYESLSLAFVAQACSVALGLTMRSLFHNALVMQQSITWWVEVNPVRYYIESKFRSTSDDANCMQTYSSLPLSRYPVLVVP